MRTDALAPWRTLRRAVREAHVLGVEFRIRGDEVEIDGIERLPGKLRDALDPDLLWSYVGAEEDDEEAIAFLDRLGAEPVLVEDAADVAAAIEQLAAEGSPVVAIDIETIAKPEYAEPRPAVQINVDGSIGRTKSLKDKTHRPAAVDPHQAEIGTVQLYAGGSQCFVFRGDAIDRVFSSPWFGAQNFIAHNAAFESAFLQHRNVHVNIGCTLQAGGLIIGTGFGGEKRSLESVSTEILGLTPPKTLQRSDWGAPTLSFGQLAYACADTVLCYRLWPKLRAELVKHRRTAAYLLQRSAVPAVAAMELRGLGIDLEEHARQSERWSVKLAEARRTFVEITGDPPPTNDSEIRDWLLRVAPHDVLATWPRTPKADALSVQGKHLKRLLHIPGTQAALDMQSMQQLLSNFGPKLAGFVSPATGRIHCAYNLASTKAGRFSASRPNLQQLPSVRAPDFRRCIIPAPGYVFVGCDWNQIEMRAAAYISGCRTLTSVYATDPVRDLHRETASAIARVPYALVTAAQRQSAKPVNFGAIYGIGALTLSEDAFDNYGIVMSEAEAQLALDAFSSTYRGFNNWRWEHWRQCQATGRVVVPGSGRTVEAAWEYGGHLRFTQCCNIPIQGRCADAMLLAIRLVHERLQGLDAGLVVSLHDELLIEASERDAEDARAILEEAMIEAFVMTFPGAPSHSVAEAVIGRNWFTVKHPEEPSERGTANGRQPVIARSIASLVAGHSRHPGGSGECP
jgi:DNA polymerase I-like protein with 3'-5' exonuclease and polymerase domains